jgi:hypothetical protein
LKEKYIIKIYILKITTYNKHKSTTPNIEANVNQKIVVGDSGPVERALPEHFQLVTLERTLSAPDFATGWPTFLGCFQTPY